MTEATFAIGLVSSSTTNPSQDVATTNSLTTESVTSTAENEVTSTKRNSLFGPPEHSSEYDDPADEADNEELSDESLQRLAEIFLGDSLPDVPEHDIDETSGAVDSEPNARQSLEISSDGSGETVQQRNQDMRAEGYVCLRGGGDISPGDSSSGASFHSSDDEYASSDEGEISEHSDYELSQYDCGEFILPFVSLSRN